MCLAADTKSVPACQQQQQQHVIKSRKKRAKKKRAASAAPVDYAKPSLGNALDRPRDICVQDGPQLPLLKVSPAVRERCGNIKGPELMRELMRFSLNVAPTDDHEIALSARLNEVCSWCHKFPFPEQHANEQLVDKMPILFICALSKLSIDYHTKMTKNGKTIVDGQITFDKIGSLMTRLVEYVIYPNEHAAFCMLNDPDYLMNEFCRQAFMYEIMIKVDKKELIKISFLMKNIVPEGLSKVRVGHSAVHGNGVFAKRQINVGEIITMHPCDVIAISDDEGMHLFRSDGKQLLHAEASMYINYLCKVEGTRLAVAGDPDKYSSASCAHIINDGAYIDNADFGLDEAVEYMEKSSNAQNCNIVSLMDCCMVAVATKVIKKGEEVFTGYGAEFWGHIAKREDIVWAWQ